MTKSIAIAKVYVVTRDAKILRRWEKRLRASGITVIDVDPKNVYNEVWHTLDADIVLIDSKDLREWVRDYLITFILSVFKIKVVLMTDRFQATAYDTAQKLKAHGYIYKNAQDAEIGETLINIASGTRCYFKSNVVLPPVKPGRFYAIRNSILEKMYGLR